MKVFVTGATVLVGAHLVLALLSKGHQVRLLVRSREKAQIYFKSHGHTLDDIVIGNMNETDKIRRALSGCDAVFHAAANVNLDIRQIDSTVKSNLESMESVIGSAINAGIKNIVWVSSTTVFDHDKRGFIDENTPLRTSKTPIPNQNYSVKNGRAISNSSAPLFKSPIQLVLSALMTHH